MPDTPRLTGNPASAHVRAASASELGSLYALFPNLAPPTRPARHEVDAWLPAAVDNAEAAVGTGAV